MSIAAILAGRSGGVIAASPDDKVGAAVTLLAKHRIGAVPVVDEPVADGIAAVDAAVVGIFSERDLVRLLAAGGPAALDQRLGDVMTLAPVNCTSETPVLQALGIMTQRRIRHLPVVDAGRLVAFVSIGDLVKYRIDRIEAEAAALRDYISG